MIRETVSGKNNCPRGLEGHTRSKTLGIGIGSVWFELVGDLCWIFDHITGCSVLEIDMQWYNFHIAPAGFGNPKTCLFS